MMASRVNEKYFSDQNLFGRAVLLEAWNEAK